MKKQIQTNRGIITVPEMHLTERDAKRNGFSYSFTARTFDGELIGDVWSRCTEKGINYPELVIVDKYLEIDDVPEDVKENVRKYLVRNDLGELDEIIRMSEHPEEHYLYGVIAKKGDTWSCWTSWNSTTSSLNCGFDNLISKYAARKILLEHYHRCER